MKPPNLILAIIALAGGLTACQSTPPTVQQRMESNQAIKNATVYTHVYRHDTSVPYSNLPRFATNGPIPQVPANPAFQNTYWLISEIQNQSVTAFKEHPWLQFLPNQTLEGTTGCNRIIGQYTLASAANVTIKTNITHQNCGDALAQEAALLISFDHTRRYILSGQTLQLIDDQGKVVMRAKAVAIPPLPR